MEPFPIATLLFDGIIVVINYSKLWTVAILPYGDHIEYVKDGRVSEKVFKKAILLTTEVDAALRGISTLKNPSNRPIIIDDGVHGSLLILYMEEDDAWTINQWGYPIHLHKFPRFHEVEGLSVPLDSSFLQLVFPHT